MAITFTPRLKALLTLAAIVVFWAIAVVGRIAVVGEVYGLDYRNYHPDGVCYARMAYGFAGIPERAKSEVLAGYQEQGSPAEVPGPLTPGNATCRFLESRVLYPLLSAPLVRVLGLRGMLVWPALSWLVAVLVPCWILVRRGAFLGAALAGGLALASATIARWSVADTVDPITMGLAALMLLPLPIFTETLSKRRLVSFIALVALASLTRQSWPIWIGLTVAPAIAWWLLRRGRTEPAAQRVRNPWVWPAVWGSATALVCWQASSRILGAQNSPYAIERILSLFGVDVARKATYTKPAPSATATISGLPTATPNPTDAGTSLLPAASSLHPAALSDCTNPIQVVMCEAKWAAESAVRVAITELGELFVLDRALVILLCLAIVSAILLWRWPSSYTFLAVLGVTAVMSLANTTVGVNFRFELPAIPFAVLMAGLLVARSRHDIMESRYT